MGQLLQRSGMGRVFERAWMVAHSRRFGAIGVQADSQRPCHTADTRIYFTQVTKCPANAVAKPVSNVC